MPDYIPRTIHFQEILEVAPNWKLKVYFIHDVNGDLSSHYDRVKPLIPAWLGMENDFNSDHSFIGFLILHHGREGIFYLINWWVGENMLHGQVFFTSHDDPTQFKHISGSGLIACVWEMEVMNHERIAWSVHVFKADKPNYLYYLNDQLNGTF